MWATTKSHFNFYRIHLLCFILIPIAVAGIFVASNGRFTIEYIDALFVCVSAATGTGLSTIDLSSLTAWQQTILVILEIVGNQVFVCWIVVYLRRYYFRKRLGHVVEAELQRSWTRRDTQHSSHSMHDLRERTRLGSSSPRPDSSSNLERKITNQSARPLRPDMVRRVDVALQPVDPNGVPARTATFDSTLVRRRAHSNNMAHDTSFGGFPGPQQVLAQTSQRLFPQLHRTLQQTLTIPRTATLIPQNTRAPQPAAAPVRPVPYLSFPADVGGNSRFKGLSEEQMLELGGVEYSALNALMWIVPLYYFGLLAVAIVIITPYMATAHQYRDVFLPPMQHRKISPIWFSVFQVTGAWANTGMSLVDQNMIPFRTAYLLIFVLFFCVLAGNTAYPVFLRFMIWCLYKAFPKKSRTHEALKFLLDHPRRCFITLFPGPQTWLLFFVLFLMNAVLFAGDLILNIDNPVTDAIPIGTRIALAVLSSAAVRSAGFQGVAISSLTPATQVLYVVMMYIAVYPIAMSVRSTNVYEENSLGIYPEDDDEDDEIDEQALDVKEHRVQIWGRHLMRHLQKQLSFDMWWLAVSLWLICIVERYGIMDPTKPWFNVFAILFEVVSAYGTVGLSLGIPTANYSLSGTFHILSKLIVCAVMLRGRHRGLPVALDRAVLLPHEFERPADGAAPAQAQPHVASPLRMGGALPEEHEYGEYKEHKTGGSAGGSVEDSERTATVTM
ncbi:TrkH-domain-containing protein [Phanerochaete sordida]|uniref:Potassium transport protein n=1 Tax=Phanerochaete sordida TaxID=48140 RepID=A0A9P3GBD9_9APHY|nr:TrkH-domain-containing protein [Phanerochaete sordida]